MEIKVTKTHKLSFQVKSFYDADGNPDEKEFGQPCLELPQALSQLELARVGDYPKRDWVIVCEVETSVTQK